MENTFYRTNSTKQFLNFIKDKKQIKKIYNNINGETDALGEYISDDVYSWDNMEINQFWNKFKNQIIETEGNQIKLVIPFGKYCKDENDSMKIVEINLLKDELNVISLYDLNLCVRNTISENCLKVVDGTFLVGFSVYEDDIYVAQFEC